LVSSVLRPGESYALSAAAAVVQPDARLAACGVAVGVRRAVPDGARRPRRGGGRGGPPRVVVVVIIIIIIIITMFTVLSS